MVQIHPQAITKENLRPCFGITFRTRSIMVDTARQGQSNVF